MVFKQVHKISIDSKRYSPALVTGIIFIRCFETDFVWLFTFLPIQQQKYTQVSVELNKIISPWANTKYELLEHFIHKNFLQILFSYDFLWQNQQGCLLSFQRQQNANTQVWVYLNMIILEQISQISVDNTRYSQRIARGIIFLRFVVTELIGGVYFFFQDNNVKIRKF